MNKMKICLIIPPSPFLLDERVFVQLGILKIAAVLEQKNYSVDLVDLSGVGNYIDVLNDYINVPGRSDIFGITATTPQIPYAVKIGQFLKSKLPGNMSKTILGGPHVTLMHTAAKREKNKNFVGSDRAYKDTECLKTYFDVLVCGDGELAIFDAITTNEKVIDADDSKSEYFLTPAQFSELPPPARHLVDMDSYKYSIEGEPALSLIAQLGCPFHCTFCSGRNSPFLRKIRIRSTESVISEVESLYLTYGVKGFMFYDDELNVNKNMISMMNELCNLQDKHGVDFKLRGFVKAELFNEEQADAMYRAGFRWLLTGFESGDPRILSNIKKIAKRDDNTRCVEIAKNRGLKVKALMSIGHAGESLESVENTKNWLLETQPEEFDCTIITTYPGSPYFDDAVKENDYYVYTDNKTGDRLYQASLNYLVDQDYYKGDPDGGYTSYVWTDHLSTTELVSAREDLEREVREKLKIPFNSARPEIKYEHSMGMGMGAAAEVKIPDFILRMSKNRNESS
jgi:anaerobic magnesium-protoporphyrin IX monomethyl ester cyclase|tara:strand:+ start:2643 stop:4175 length:1533 start_codon:yes stop_codon:yes gene_type:complete